MTSSRTLSIGGGTMARAIIAGSVGAGVRSGADWLVAEPDPERRAVIGSMGARVFASAREAIGDLDADDQILLAVKPQMFAGVAEDLSGLLAERVVVSIMAGVPSQKVREALGGAARVIRVMPNTPAQIGAGATAIALGAGAHKGDDASAREIFSAVGPVVESLDEDIIAAFTALAGSGPAYVFYLAEAMRLAGESIGFARGQADRIARQTILGAAMLLSESDGSSEALRAAVTSKEGTTQAATDVLDDADLRGVLRRAITAARDRGRELGREV